MEIKVEKCHHCQSHNLKRDERRVKKKQVFDLELRPLGIVRRVSSIGRCRYGVWRAIGGSFRQGSHDWTRIATA